MGERATEIFQKKRGDEGQAIKSFTSKKKNFEKGRQCSDVRIGIMLSLDLVLVITRAAAFCTSRRRKSTNWLRPKYRAYYNSPNGMK